jgi:hypothetical protein
MRLGGSLALPGLRKVIWLVADRSRGGRKNRRLLAQTSNTRVGQVLRFLGAWHRQASVISGLSSRALMAGRLTRTAGNPL